MQGCGCENEPHTCESDDDREIAQLRASVKAQARQLNAAHGKVDAARKIVEAFWAGPHASALNNRVTGTAMHVAMVQLAEVLKRSSTAPSPVCAACEDTHRMTLGERTVPCTQCPTPCQLCRLNGYGAFCTHTPCPCKCHERTTP